MLLNSMQKDKAICPPEWLPDNTVYLCVTGSESYGCADQVVLRRDKDIMGICVPPKRYIFPASVGHIEGFGKPKDIFEQYQQHHIEWNRKEYDISVYNIAKIFWLMCNGNPNCVETLFVDRDCVLHSTQIAEHIRHNRRIFLSKKCYHSFRGYAFSQLQLCKRESTGNRKLIKEQHGGVDVKALYHIVRLCLECEQILEEYDIDLRRHSDFLKAIRRGEYTFEQVENLFTEKEKLLEKLYNDSKIPYSSDQEKIRQLLLECLEMHYGSLSALVKLESDAEIKLRQIKEILG